MVRMSCSVFCCSMTELDFAWQRVVGRLDPVFFSLMHTTSLFAILACWEFSRAVVQLPSKGNKNKQAGINFIMVVPSGINFFDLWEQPGA